MLEYTLRTPLPLQKCPNFRLLVEPSSQEKLGCGLSNQFSLQKMKHLFCFLNIFTTTQLASKLALAISKRLRGYGY
jgi:hypothetical protein